jgi:hypothetical protein
MAKLDVLAYIEEQGEVNSTDVLGDVADVLEDGDEED